MSRRVQSQNGDLQYGRNYGDPVFGSFGAVVVCILVPYISVPLLLFYGIRWVWKRLFR